MTRLDLAFIKQRMVWAILALAAGIVASMLITGCGEIIPRPGTAQDQSATASARATTAIAASDSAMVDAAKTKAQAQELERQATATPTPELIKRAADARVAAASAAAVAEALHRVAQEADAAATAKAQAAATAAKAERLAQDACDQRNRAWWIAAIATGAAGLAAALLIGLHAPVRWQCLPAAIAIGGWSVAAWAQWAGWIVAGLGIALVLALITAAILAVRQIARIEWPDAVDSLRRARPEAADAHNIASVARQSLTAKTVVNWLLRGVA